ncbi:MAG: bifunctional hydroxymethylpyrimidine kinase/phosphomethylpyrimidine kinase [Duncaniella sp.]|nr:bifunctional hydroxymethylpyrimidine kinase/phosphomethylpyrimidine kinase [Duncaniella sp.]
MNRYFTVLSIAGSDPSGGAGIQADLKTISAIGCYGMTAITAITVQNTTGVTDVQAVEPHIVEGQIDVVTSDIPPMAIKTGMLFDADIVRAVGRGLRKFMAMHPEVPVVVDPVMVSTSGSMLLSPDAVSAMCDEIFPLATIITPNIHEARVLTGFTAPADQWQAMWRMGCRNVLLKGGDSECKEVKTDYLCMNGHDELVPIEAEAVETENTHGTGCTLSAAIASYLAMGCDLVQAVKNAKQYITGALRAGARVAVGQGHGPVNHFFDPQQLKIIV